MKTLIQYWWECKLAQPLWKTVWMFLKKKQNPENRSTIWFGNSLLGIQYNSLQFLGWQRVGHDWATKLSLSLVWKKRKWKLLSHVWLFVTPWTVARQAPLSMGFSRQEYWCGLPCSPSENLPNSGIKPASLSLSWIGKWVLYQ